MDSERVDRGGRVPLPGFGEPAREDWASRSQPAPDRRDGIRHVRRMSNWTLAALIAGTGTATVALAHQAFPAATGAGTTAAAATGAASTTTAHGASGPHVGHSVATTSGSGVTVTTTTHTVHGKTVVTHVRHVPAYHDN
jgi:hypothetical protein